MTDGTADWRTVQTGIQDNRFIEIKSGLTADDRIIIGPYQAVSRSLSNGDEVEVQEDIEEEEE
jgi:HlyD family secretion protein